MRRREYLATATVSLSIGAAGCTDSDPSEEEGSDESSDQNPSNGPNSTDGTSDNGTNESTGSSVEIQPASIESVQVSDGEVDRGNSFEVTATVAFPSDNNVVEAELTATLKQNDGESSRGGSISIAESVDEERVEFTRAIPIESDDLKYGAYQVTVTLDGPEIERISTVGPTVEIVDPYGESRTAVQDRIDTAEEALDAAMGEYESYTGDGPTATGNFDFSDIDILRATQPAITAVDEAREYDLEEIDQGGRVDDLENEIELVRGIARAQTDANDVHEACDGVFDIYVEGVSGVSNPMRNFEDDSEEFRTRIRGEDADSLENLESNVSSEGSQRNYTPIIEEYNAEYDALQEYYKIIKEQVHEGDNYLGYARSNLESEQYNSAEADAERSINAFESVIDKLEELEPVALSELIDAHVETIEGWIDEADEIRISAIEEQ